jgi:hypothetical protein
MRLFCIFATFIFLILSRDAIAGCKDLHRFYAIVDLKTKDFKLTKIDSTSEKFCEDLVIPPNANLEISITKKDYKFSTKIYRSFYTFWDHPEDNGKWSGGVMPQTKLYIDSFLPSWHKGALIKIRDLNNNKIISEAKL